MKVKYQIALQILLFAVVATVFVYIEWHKDKDFYVYLRAAQDLLNGQQIFGPTKHVTRLRYFYSPFFAWLLGPVCNLPWKPVVAVWTVLQLIGIGALLKEMKLYNPEFNASHKVAILWLAMSLRPILLNVSLGQVNLVLLVLTLIGVRWIFSSHWFAGATLLAFGIAIKPVSLIMLPYLLYRGQFRAVMAAVGCIVLFLLLPATTIGWQENIDLLQTWMQVLSKENSLVFLKDHSVGLHGIFSWFLLTPLSDSNIQLLLTTTRAGFLASLVLVLGKPTRGPLPKEKILPELAYALLLMTLISPHQQKYALVTIAPAYAAILTPGYAQKRHLYAGTLALSFALFTLTSDGFIGWDAYTYIDSYRPMTWGALLMLLALFLRNREQKITVIR